MAIDVAQDLCEKITPIIAPLSQHIKLNAFGYRKFFPDGTSFKTSNRFELTRVIHEKFNNTIIPNYETEVRLSLKEKKRYFFRIGEPDRQDTFLSMLYDFDIWNTLSLYEKNEECVDAVYFTSTRENYKIISDYFNNLEFLENFSRYFKDKINDIISPQEMKKISSLTVSPKIFEEHDTHGNPYREPINLMP
jgi:hypothetical protein